MCCQPIRVPDRIYLAVKCFTDVCVALMKININTTITGHTVKLVPYRKEHVACYHTWMEEYDMQMSWSQDPDSMVGDVNLFITNADEPQTAELEIMIAEQNSRRNGIASEALNLFMAYAIQHLDINKFQVKIGDTNQSSLRLFKKLGFEQVSHSQVFHEVTLELPVTKAVSDKYHQVASQLKTGSYD